MRKILKRITRFFLYTLTAAMISTALARAVPLSGDYSDQQKSAAMSVEQARHHINTLGERCISHDNSDYTLRFLLHLTAIDNMDVTLPADKILATLTPALKEQLAQQLRHEVDPLEGTVAICESFKADLRQGRLDYAYTNPEQSKILRDIFASDETMRISKRDQDIKAGCMKNRYNNGARAFDETLGQCECMLTAIKRGASDPQIDSWLASLDKTPPWWAVVITDIMQCQPR